MMMMMMMKQGWWKLRSVWPAGKNMGEEAHGAKSLEQ
jgi:hypothetical protein